MDRQSNLYIRVRTSLHLSNGYRTDTFTNVYTYDSCDLSRFYSNPDSFSWFWLWANRLKKPELQMYDTELAFLMNQGLSLTTR